MTTTETMGAEGLALLTAVFIIAAIVRLTRFVREHKRRISKDQH